MRAFILSAVHRAALGLTMTLAACATAPPAPPPQPAWPDHATYLARLWQRCDRNDLDACRALGGEDDEGLRARAGEKACALGDAATCRWEAERMQKLEPEHAEALLWRACDALDDFQSCFDLAAGFDRNGRAQNGPHALAAAKLLCERHPSSDIACGPALSRLRNAPDSEVDPMVRAFRCGSASTSCPAMEARFFLFDGERYGLKRVAHGMELLDLACRSGDADACESESELEYSGALAPARREVAVQRATVSCEADQKQSCFFLARVYLAPGRWQGLRRAIDAFQQACSENSACQRAAGEHLAAHAHLSDARPFFEQACQGGDPDGCEDLGRLRVLQGERGAKVEALLQPPCESGAKAACRALAAITSGKRASRYRELGREHDPLSESMQASYDRSLHGKPSPGDTALMTATVMTGGFVGLFALHPASPTGFGFDRIDYPDP